ncbi:Rv3654c family TadE-like protein [Gordonia sp. UBA7599]|uniref:Rv3654c family TadE-like protein n=1 Tax=unclassified Gordonia (in: high G+C Gram-positive bacteria) TaxID=2657482 RepID=UPI000FBCC93B|nr:Rv3654c family TadE-like protein [Gordonia sp. UBA7599]RUP38736.1 MAG: pilus assembly protein TadE [Gordonia sp. (in: high G+C Gram-positive bacteria)]HNP58626.1 flp pilus-assembly TadE/G-like family protein [Gordonia sp. (in: high G+C Gram-positive bacteria)]
MHLRRPLREGDVATVRWSVVRRVHDEDGSATVLGVAVIACLVVLTASLVLVGTAVVARHRATAAAELAALAAASAALTGSAEPCAAAERLVRAQGDSSLRLASCELDGEFVDVEVAVPVRLSHFGVRSASARARAGPVGAE